MAIIKKFRIKSFKNLKPIIKLDKVSFSFKKRPILDTISFNLNQGEILGLLGPNLVAAHCTHVDEQDLNLLSQNL